MGYIPPEPGMWIETTSIDSLRPEGIFVTKNRLTDAQRVRLSERWNVSEGRRSHYDPKPVLRQAMVGYYLIVAFVLTTAALVWVLVSG